jgi:uncharacterized protein YcbK (DUF882 family)
MANARRLVVLALVAAPLLLTPAACTVIVPAKTRFAHWHDQHRAEIERYDAYLRAEGVADIVPAPGLLRTARRWRKCGKLEFAVPPEDLQANMPPTLRLVARLRDAGILDPRLARSVYRDAAMNTCAGGSGRSKHLENRAIDFDLPARGDNVDRLCAFWREHGQAANMGLGFYSPTTIHVDTAGYRTWGGDYTWRTSLCTRPEEATTAGAAQGAR